MLWQDVRVAARRLLREPGFAVPALVALALGISVNSTVFTIVNAVLLRPLPFDEPERIVSVGTWDSRTRAVPGPVGYGALSYAEFQDWRNAARTFAGMAAYSETTMNVSGEGGAPERFLGAFLSAASFRLIGQSVALGRDFVPDDDRPGAPAVVILSDAVWRDRHASDPSVVGRAVRVNGVPSTIIGVMPAGFQFPSMSHVWQPLSLMPNLGTLPRDARVLSVFGRLATGVSAAEARAELETIAARLAREHPDSSRDIRPTLTPYVERYMAPQLRLIFMAMMGAVGFVLLIACANVMNLLLARAARRSGEMSVRVSLGATPWRIVRQLLVESVLLATLAGVLGLFLSVASVRLFSLAVTAFGPRPYWLAFTFDLQVFGFLATVCLAAAMICGLAPALQVARTSASDVLKDSARTGTSGRARRWTSALVTGELALTLVLLAGAGGFARTFLDLYRFDVGIDTAGLMRMRLDLPQAEYPASEQRAAFYQQLETRVAQVPGVSATSVVASRFPAGGGQAHALSVEGRPAVAGERLPTVSVLPIGPKYFEVLELPLLRGRTFTDVDGSAGNETAIVNERFASMYSPNESPLGRRLVLTPRDARDTPPSSVAIVGVSPTAPRNANRGEQEPVVYVPYAAQPLLSANLLVRAQADAGAIAALLRHEVRSLDADLPVFDITTMDEWLAYTRSPQRVFGSMFAIFAALALVLAAVGLYAVTAYSVTLRTREIGIRMALGARATQVWWLVGRGSLVQLAIGLVIGLAGALAVGRLMRGMWSSGNDPAMLVAVATLLAGVMVTSSFWPARRAARLNPIAALRSE